MQIYSFWSADTTYFTVSKSLRKAQAVGRDNMRAHAETCEYLGVESTVDSGYFIPQDVEQVEVSWFKHFVKTDPDTLILDDELYTLIDSRKKP